MSAQGEIRTSILKILSSLITIPGLGATITEFIDLRGKIKQQRLNDFTELLANYFSNNKGISLESFQIEDFGDLFEAVLKRVVQTKSKEKHRRFRDILVHKIENPHEDIDESEVFLDLISSLSEVEILMLSVYKALFSRLPKSYRDLVMLSNLIDYSRLAEITADCESIATGNDEEVIRQLNELRQKQAIMDKDVRDMLLVRNHTYFNISEDLFMFYKQRLSSKGLIIEYGIGAIESEPFEMVTITEFGSKFVTFVLGN